MTKAVELRQVEYVMLLLDFFTLSKESIGEVRKKFYGDKLKINSKYLIMACNQDDLDMVKAFIKQKCRLTITSEQKKDSGDFFFQSSD